MAPRKRNASEPSATKILAIDVGGTGLKAAVMDTRGRFLSERLKVKTPHHCKPAKLVAMLAELVSPLKGYDHVSIGFPGYVRDGKVFTAPNLGTKAWAGFRLAQAIHEKLGKPTRLNNDADVQGLAVISGKGLELVCTLGTGFGTAWFRDGELLPHMDLAHLVVRKKDDFDVYVGDRTKRKLGNPHWNKRIKKLIGVLQTVFAYDHLYLGGGNGRSVKFRVPRNVTIVSNDAGMEGGA